MGNGGYMKVVVLIAVDGTAHQLESPWLERGEAENHLSTIRGMQESADLIDLPWLSVQGARVIAAHLIDKR